jgi:transposase InsO family protein
MPWKVSDPVSERTKFVVRLLEGERMTDLCREFGISRKTGHKIWKRYQTVGLDGLKDGFRRPYTSPSKTPQAKIDRILAMRRKYSTWGPRKIRSRLIELEPKVLWPAKSTIGVILKNEGLVKPRKQRKRASPSPTPFNKSTKPNEIWCVDFKGQFQLGNRMYCYPLTLTDHFSRYLLGCEALDSTKSGPAQTVLEEVFIEYGLPNAMLSDNGSPFASTGRMGLSKLSVWLMRHNIRLDRIEPGHPEQNGRHERMHLTLKQDATRPPGNNLLQQQEKLDRFREQYNTERPHEALDDATPSSVYTPSSRKYEKVLEELRYPLHDFTQRVSIGGHVSFPPILRRIYVGEAFSGENLGFREIEIGTWLVSFMDLKLGYVDEKTRGFLPRKVNSSCFFLDEVGQTDLTAKKPIVC